MENPFIRVHGAIDDLNDACKKMSQSGLNKEEIDESFKDFTNASIFAQERKQLDCMKISSLEEVKIILDSLDLYVIVGSKNYHKLKHLVK